jgi:hypothetical protein
MSDKQHLAPSSEYEAKIREADSLKRIAFVGVCLSTMAVMCAVFTVPMLYDHMQHVQSLLQEEVQYCKSQSMTLRHELGRTRVLVGAQEGAHGRVARQWGSQGNTATYGDNNKQTYEPYSTQYKAPNAPVVVQPPQEQLLGCCTCHVGRAGPSGPIGNDGRDGRDGYSGVDGSSGNDGTGSYSNACGVPSCVECPISQAGDIGVAGLPGRRGSPGDQGLNSDGGERGPNGAAGRAGPAGAAGRPGSAGFNGDAGRMVLADAPEGPPGMMGEPGSKGEPGAAGRAGKKSDGGIRGEPGQNGDAGTNGTNGINGPPGLQGISGALGLCTHCTPPRTAPGY